MRTTLRAALLAVLAIVALLGGTTAATADPARCDRGELCLWSASAYRGDLIRVSLSTTNPDECVPVPSGLDARSFANLLRRPVTVYQSAECATEGEFDTYPGGGTYVPYAPFVVRGLQIWQS
ncbi:peptidase inhibitor family I36 protein [Actinokineospora sp.]|uniref:peptidase inhibitor family I36 protein n=1 Tax=Actinokineospora sp. TaxID=1872133 RepID=UPI004037722E